MEHELAQQALVELLAMLSFYQGGGAVGGAEFDVCGRNEDGGAQLQGSRSRSVSFQSVAQVQRCIVEQAS